MNVEKLIAKAKKRLESIQPEEVEVVLGDRIVTVRIPMISGEEFSALMATRPPRLGVPRDYTLGFSLTEVAGSYPNVTLADGDTEDRMLAIEGENKTRYQWPEVFAALGSEDRGNIEAAIWGMHFHNPTVLKQAMCNG